MPQSYPLTPLQEGMLYHHLSAPGGPGPSAPGVDVEQIVCTFRETVDLEALQKAWDRAFEVIPRLGAALQWEGLPAPVQEDGLAGAPRIRVIDRAGGHGDPLEDFLRDDRAEAFDLAAPPLSRLTFIAARPDGNGAVEGLGGGTLVWTLPHVLMDGRSFALVLRTVLESYDALREGQAPPPIEPFPSFADFVRWERERDAGAEQAAWTAYLEGFTAPTPLPFEGMAGSGSGRGSLRLELDEALTGQLRTLAADASTSLGRVVQAAWGLLLARHAATDDVVLGEIRAGRKGTCPGADRMVGVLIGTLPLRLHVDPELPAVEWIARLARERRELHPVERAPLVRIRQWSGLPQGHPLFESLVVYDHASLGSAIGTAPARTFELREHTPFPLTLYAQGEPRLHLELAWDRARIPDPGAAELLRQLVELLRALAAEPALPLGELASSYTDATGREEEWNRTDRPIPPRATLHSLVVDRLRNDPKRGAVTCAGHTLSAAELDALSNRLAQHLRAHGAGPGTIVGVALPRSAEMVVVLLGILKVGAAYLPLDPGYPAERLGFMLEDSGATLLVSTTGAVGALHKTGVTTLLLDRDAPAILQREATPLPESAGPADLAYVIYTSGSTGRPKGVQVEHRNVVNFLVGMDEHLGAPGPGSGAWLSLTSLSFDISVLELFWPLSRGLPLAIFRDPIGEPGGDPGPFLRHAETERASPASPRLAFSLFYFAADSEARDGFSAAEPYRLLLEGARFADAHGFSAVWTPERHFHAFGGLYPNPSVTGAAIAAVTSRVGIRAGSVVLPLHHPVRVAEEWSVVDNLSGGRVGLSLASGWHPNDFVLAPDRHADRKEILYRDAETIRRLWRGERLPFPGPDGNEVEIGILPRPVQPELPLWITTAGSPETWVRAGQMGAHVLTHLLGQTPDELGERIRAYRAAWREAGHPGDGGTVSLMLHTFVGEDTDRVREQVREPMKAYLRTSVGLIRNFADAWTAYRKTGTAGSLEGAQAPATTGEADDFARLSAEDLEALLDFAFERYFETSGLFGSPERCVRTAEQLRGVGVDEIACLVDFGVDPEQVLQHLPLLAEVHRRVNGTRSPERGDTPEFGDQVRAYGVTHVQCTPSRLRMLLADPDARDALRGVPTFLVGGEALPAALAQELRGVTGGRVLNMYGPTETTIWSSVHEVTEEDRSGTVPIGRPIANTTMHVLDARFRPLPPGIPGELHIGGLGVVRGYLGRPELDLERFLPDPFAPPPLDGRPLRMYRTGDLVRRRPDGVLDFLGRTDTQVKLRGHRIELGEIEAALQEHPGVADAAVLLREDTHGDPRLVAYLVSAPGGETGTLREWLGERLPPVMVPGELVTLDALPLTPNRKVDRKALPDPRALRPPPEPPRSRTGARTEASASAELHTHTSAPATHEAEPPPEVVRQVTALWKELLGVEHVGLDDNFFDLGGHSLLTVRVHARLREAYLPELRITDLFRYPTVRTLASFLGTSVDDGAPTPPPSPVEGARDRGAQRRAALRRRAPGGATS